MYELFYQHKTWIKENKKNMAVYRNVSLYFEENISSYCKF